MAFRLDHKEIFTTLPKWTSQALFTHYIFANNIAIKRYFNIWHFLATYVYWTTKVSSHKTLGNLYYVLIRACLGLLTSISFYCNIFLSQYLFIAISFYHNIFLSQYLFIAILCAKMFHVNRALQRFFKDCHYKILCLNSTAICIIWYFTIFLSHYNVYVHCILMGFKENVTIFVTLLMLIFFLILKVEIRWINSKCSEINSFYN